MRFSKNFRWLGKASTATWCLLGILVLSAAWRGALVMSGGQQFFPDEARYAVSRDAVDQIAEGNWRQGLSLPVAGGDHPGFKLVGMIPAAGERLLGFHVYVPGGFFALFSLLNIWLVGVVCRRFGGDEREAMWASLAAATSTTLLYYCRHWLPYDLAIACALGAIAVGGVRHWGRLAAGGFLAGWGVVCYLGSWQLVGIAAVLMVLVPSRTVREAALRSECGLAGFAGALLVPWVIDQTLGAGQMVANARSFSATITQGDYDTWGVFSTYFWQAEQGWLVVVLVAVAWLGGRLGVSWRGGTESWARGPVGVTLLALGALLGSFVIAADVLEKFVVYGRLARQATPFLALLLGVALAAWTRDRSRRVVVGVAIALVLVSAPNFWRVARIQFPHDFAAKWRPVLEEESLAPSPESFPRFVNVDRYVFAAEILPEGAGVTIAAAPHPFEFKPYLFDLYPAEERARRAVVDHRMRVVRINAADLPEVAGEAYGEVRLKVDLPALRPGFPEPLLSIGPRHDGEVLYVRFLTEQLFVLGAEGWGRFLFESEPQTFVPGKTLEVVYFSGALLPDERKAREPGSWGEGRSLQRARSLVRVRLGDEVVIDRIGASKAADPQLVHAGVNRVEVGSAGQRFTGQIFEVRRGGLPEMVDEAMPEWGVLRIDFEMPDAASGRREPLFSLGVPGEAVIGYLIPNAGRKGRIGVEVWGIGAFESEEVSFRPGLNKITFAVGSLFPPEVALEWAGQDVENRRRLLAGIGITLNGAPILEKEVVTPRRAQIGQELNVGANAVGGSHVLPEFTGRILRWELSPSTGDEI